MFETNQDAEMPIQEVSMPLGRQAWSYVTLRLHIPWFHVVCQMVNPKGELFQEMMFLSNVDPLTYLQKASGKSILQIDLVSPGVLNGTSRWRMEPLAEVWQGIEPDELSVPAHIYVLSDGTRYVKSTHGTHEHMIYNKQLLFNT